MSVQVKYKNGYIGVASEKAAEAMEKRGEVEIVGVDEKQPDLTAAEKPKRSK